MAIDRGDAHFDEAKTWQRACRHIALFLHWGAVRGLTSSRHDPAAIARATTAYVLSRCDGKLLDRDFADEGRAFAQAEYGAYLAEVHAYAGKLGISDYDIADDEVTARHFFAWLDGRLASWREHGGARREPTTELFARVGRELSPMGFKLVKSRRRFERRRGPVADAFTLTLLRASAGTRIQPGVNIRYEELDRIYHQVSGARPADRVHHAAISFGIATVFGDRARYEVMLAGLNRVDDAGTALMRIFEDVALPFFDRHSTIADVDRLYNEDPSSSLARHYLLHHFARCAYATIAAKLVGNPRYDEITRIYAAFLQEVGGGYRATDYEKLRELLARA